MRRFRLSAVSCLAAAAIFAGVLSSPGCVGITSHVLWWMGADRVPAECSALEGQTVAVICESPNSSFGPDAETEALSREVEKILRYKVPRAKLVRFDEIASWLDEHGSHQIDYRAVGRGVKADRVVSIKLKSFSYHDNPTLYQGKADYEVAVYDVKEGNVLYADASPDFQFPAKDAYHTTEMSEAKFQREFIKWLGADIARRFHDNELPKRFEEEHTIER